jgi:carbonic anhydrase
VPHDFADILEANRRYAESFRLAGLAAPAARELGVLTCIDSRIEPLSMLGLEPGDANIFRNAGARVSDDALRSLVLATNLLNVRRIMIVQHTDCAMGGVSDEELRARIAERLGDPGLVEGFEPSAMVAPHDALAAGVARLRDCPLIPAGTAVAGFEYDVTTGLLTKLVD